MLTKRLQQDEGGWRIIPFSAGAWYGAFEASIAGFTDLVTILEQATHVTSCAVVRGRLLPHVDPTWCRRLCDRGKHGDAVTFEATARRWLALDVDSLPEPPGCIFAVEPEDGIEHALGLLPEPFRDASCWWQATGSAGIKPGIHCRLWFWLSRPVDDAEAKGWLAGSPVDRSLYSAVALHYVAAPILVEGARDPVIRRHGVRKGLDDTLTVPAELPRAATIEAVPVDLDGEELTVDELETLAAATLSSPVVAELWDGERSYPDRSTGHFALAAALARAGCRDPGTIHHVLVAWDRRHGRDLSKVQRPDYAARTIGRALAVEAGA
jgi:hypothetical protein